MEPSFIKYNDGDECTSDSKNDCFCTNKLIPDKVKSDQTAGDCQTELCSGSRDNNGDIPQDSTAVGDCQISGCEDGSPTPVDDNGDTPRPEDNPDNFCKTCSRGTISPDPTKKDMPLPGKRCEVCEVSGTSRTLPERASSYDKLTNIKECPDNSVQNDVKHDIDGCSTPGSGFGLGINSLEDWDNLPFTQDYDKYVTNPIWGKPLGIVNDATAQSVTEPCNIHDVCYQTCGSDQAACDDALGVAIADTCAGSYPLPCTNSPDYCNEYIEERDDCQGVGDRFRNALGVAGGFAWKARQTEYCQCCKEP